MMKCREMKRRNNKMTSVKKKTLIRVKKIRMQWIEPGSYFMLNCDFTGYVATFLMDIDSIDVILSYDACCSHK